MRRLQIQVSGAWKVPLLRARDQLDAGPGDLREPFAALTRVLQDLPAHARIPVTPQVIRDVFRCFRGILSCKERRDFVRHGDEMVCVHEHQSRRR